MKNTVKKIISGVIASAMLMGVCGCGKYSKDTVCLSESVKPKANISANQLDDKFVNGTADFAINLFRQNVNEGENSVISPLSIMLALSMTANGASGETLANMQKALGGNDIDSLNKYLYTYIHSLPESEKAKLVAANSIWIRDDGSIEVKKDFLQKNADYYDADAYKAPFDEATLKDINKWVYKNTDKQINSILSHIEPSAVMYLLNAITFEADWDEPYEKAQVQKADFHGTNGTSEIDMMYSQEGRYLDDGSATGFMKDYADGYSYAILMPNEGISLPEYIGKLSGEGFVNMLKGAEYCKVIAAMPKFKSEYSVGLNEALKAMGMTDAFDASADFSKINGRHDLYIGNVLHKAVINVDEEGTKAGAATAIEIKCEAALEEDMPKVVTVDRPFIYAIVDNQTNLPIFIGAVSNL